MPSKLRAVHLSRQVKCLLGDWRAVQEVYRGHVIRLSRARVWSAVLTEVATGAMLPTKATALDVEGYAVALMRARKLVDMYVAAYAAAQSDAA